jgi:hypothetical protein
MMTQLIELNDGRIEIVQRVEDLLPLIEKHMGYDSMQYLREYLEEQEKARKEYEDLQNKYDELQERKREVLEDLMVRCDRIASCFWDEGCDEAGMTAAIEALDEVIRKELD